MLPVVRDTSVRLTRTMLLPSGRVDAEGRSVFPPCILAHPNDPRTDEQIQAVWYHHRGTT